MLLGFRMWLGLYSTDYSSIVKNRMDFTTYMLFRNFYILFYLSPLFSSFSFLSILLPSLFKAPSKVFLKYRPYQNAIASVYCLQLQLYGRVSPATGKKTSFLRGWKSLPLTKNTSNYRCTVYKEREWKITSIYSCKAALALGAREIFPTFAVRHFTLPVDLLIFSFTVRHCYGN